MTPEDTLPTDERTRTLMEVWQELETLYWTSSSESLGFERTREARLAFMEVQKMLHRLNKSEPQKLYLRTVVGLFFDNEETA